MISSLVNLKMLFVSCLRVPKIIHTLPAGKTFLMEFWMFLELKLIVNEHVTQYWLFIQKFYTVLKEATIKRLF